MKTTRIMAVPLSAIGLLSIAAGRYAGAGEAPATESAMTSQLQHATSTSVPQGPAAQDTAIRPFRIHFSEAALDDLRRRITATRWPEKETVPDQSQGVPLAMVRDLARYWAAIEPAELRRIRRRLTERLNELEP